MADCEIVDIIRYDTGFLMIVKFRYRDTTWYAPVPCTRAQIESNLQGQKALSLEENQTSSEGSSVIGWIALIFLALVVVKGIEFTLGALVIIAALYGSIKSLRI
jgi:hypothetical protein